MQIGLVLLIKKGEHGFYTAVVGNLVTWRSKK